MPGTMGWMSLKPAEAWPRWAAAALARRSAATDDGDDGVDR